MVEGKGGRKKKAIMKIRWEQQVAWPRGTVVTVFRFWVCSED